MTDHDETQHTAVVKGIKYTTVERAAAKWKREPSTIEAWIREDDIPKQYASGHWWVPEARLQEAFRKRRQDERVNRLMRRYSATHEGT